MSDIPIIDPHIEFGLLQNQPSDRNLLQRTRFKMNIQRLPTTTFHCQSINIPSLQIGIAEQTTLFNPIPRPAGSVSHDILKVAFLVDETLKSWLDIRTWLMQCSDYKDFTEYQPPSQHFDSKLVILINSSKHNPTHRITFENAFPVILSSIDLDSSDPISDYIVAHAGFAFTSYSVESI